MVEVLVIHPFFNNRSASETFSPADPFSCQVTRTDTDREHQFYIPEHPIPNMIHGISHLTFIVSDLDRMSTLLETIFEAKEVYASDDKKYSLSREKFFLIGELWIAIMAGEPLPNKTYNHVAFKIAASEFEVYLNRIQSLGLKIVRDRGRFKEEGRSIYFYDYDNHLFELHTGTLAQRLAFYNTPRQ